MTDRRSKRDDLERAQTAAAESVRRGARLLTTATVENGHLTLDGEPLTADRLLTVIEGELDEYTVGYDDRTVVKSGSGGLESPLTPGDPIQLDVRPIFGAYYGRLARTFVVDSDGGTERRSQIALDGAFRSTKALVSARSATVGAIEADLEAEIRAFGFDASDEIETRVFGVGPKSPRRPLDPKLEVGPGTIVAIEAAVDGGEGRRVRIADLLVRERDGATWLGSLPRSLNPSTVAESVDRL